MILFAVLAVSLIAYVVLANRWYKRERFYKYQGMVIYLGLPGSGKTYALIYHVVRSLASGRRVMTNFQVRHDRILVALQVCYGFSYRQAKKRLALLDYCRTFDDLISCVHTDIYLDEVQDMLRSQDWAIMPMDVINFFAQHRHRGCRIKMATHKLGAIHNYIRELTSTVYLATPCNFVVRMFRSILGIGKMPLLQYSMAKDANDELMDKPRKKAKGRIFNFFLKASYMTLDPRIANCYDTHGGVLPSPMDEVRKESGQVKRYELEKRTFNPYISRPLDGLPCLSYQETVQAMIAGDPPQAELFKRWQQVTPRASVSARGASGRVQSLGDRPSNELPHLLDAPQLPEPQPVSVPVPSSKKVFVPPPPRKVLN